MIESIQEMIATCLAALFVVPCWISVFLYITNITDPKIRELPVLVLGLLQILTVPIAFYVEQMAERTFNNNYFYVADVIILPLGIFGTRMLVKIWRILKK